MVPCTMVELDFYTHKRFNIGHIFLLLPRKSSEFTCYTQASTQFFDSVLRLSSSTMAEFFKEQLSKYLPLTSVCK